MKASGKKTFNRNPIVLILCIVVITIITIWWMNSYNPLLCFYKPLHFIAPSFYSDNTSTWQKYTSSDFNYSIQYPSYIQIVPITENYFEGEKYLERDNIKFVDTSTDKNGASVKQCINGEQDNGMRSYPTYDGFSLIITRDIKSKYNNFEFLKTENPSYIKTKSGQLYVRNLAKDFPNTIQAFIYDGNYIYYFTTTINPEKRKEYMALFTKMASTFQIERKALTYSKE